MKTAALLSILVCASVHSVAAQRRPLTYQRPAEMFRLLEGEWAFGSHDCQNPFVFTVARDRKSIKLSYKETDERTGEERNGGSVYRVIDVSRARIRAQIEGEERLTEDGKPVVWDFYFFSRDEFRWHRTDWTEMEFTGPATRCKTALKKGPLA